MSSVKNFLGRPAAAPPAPQTPEIATDGALSILRRLARSEPQSVPELAEAMKGSGMGLQQFLSVLTNAREAGLVKFEGQEGQEEVTLTASGRRVAQPSP